MYIYPNTDIYLLNGVSLNADYDHTIYFSSLGLQSNFFLNHTKYSLSNNYYVRKERGYIQVEKNQNDLWDCTYMMYRNTSYKNKWFYAFITSVDYVNDSVSLIHFEIDVIQTWWNECILDKCFVEREHASDDTKFTNLVEEDLDIGTDLSVQLFRRKDLIPDRVCVVFTSVVDTEVDPPELISPPMRFIGDYFCGVGFISFNASDTSQGGGREQLGNFLRSYINNGFEDAILSVYQIPHFISTAMLDPYNTDTFSVTPNLTNIDGYVPKNNKLFNYPYNFLKLTNNKGDDVIFKHEMWDNANNIGEFELRGVGLGVPAVMCYPLNYRDIAKDFENGLMYSGFNECAWAGDAYQVWLAQNRKNMEMAAKIGVGALLVGGALALGGATAGTLPMLTLPASAPVEIGAGNLLGAAAGNVASKVAIGAGSTGLGGTAMKYGGASLLGSILNTVRAKNKLEATPRPAHGHTTNDIFNMQNGLAGYTCYQMTVKSEFARIIDEYFSRFGYACHRIKIPNRNARQNWTYVKTIGCEINGNIPSDDAVKIKAIYDHGITFWNNGNNIGNYGDFTNPVYS